MKQFNLTPAGRIWGGTLESLHAFLHGNQVALNDNTFKPKVQAEEDGEGVTYLPRILRIVNGDTAVVSVKGSLVTDDSWINEWLGRTSYPEIRNAVVHALLDPNVKRILMMVDSGGGQVNGVSDLTSFLTKAAKVKPLITHASGYMCSAAYWVGSCAPTILASETANIGSIGAVIVHAELSESLKEDGVNVTVVRSGPYKYLGNMYEKLSEEALAELQLEVDEAERIFVRKIAENRKKGEDYVRRQMGQGKVFIANTAKDVGLVDAVYNYDDMMTKVLSGAFDNQTQPLENTVLGGNTMTAQVKDMATLQALAEQGIDVGDVTIAQHEANAGEDGTQTQDDTTVTSASPTEPATPEASADGGEGEATLGFTKDAYTEKLEAKIEEKDEAIINLKVEARAKDDRIAALEATLEPMKAIVAQSAKNMATGLGQVGADFSGLSVEALVDQHKTLATTFQEKFKAGGISAAQPKTTHTLKPQLSAKEKAALRSTKLA